MRAVRVLADEEIGVCLLLPLLLLLLLGVSDEGGVGLGEARLYLASLRVWVCVW